MNALVAVEAAQRPQVPEIAQALSLQPLKRLADESPVRQRFRQHGGHLIEGCLRSHNPPLSYRTTQDLESSDRHCLLKQAICRRPKTYKCARCLLVRQHPKQESAYCSLYFPTSSPWARTCPSTARKNTSLLAPIQGSVPSSRAASSTATKSSVASRA